MRIAFATTLTLILAALAQGAALAQEKAASEAGPDKAKGAPFIEGPVLAAPVASDGWNFVRSADEANAPDLAYGAYQRGFYLSAFKLALKRAELGDPAAQTLLAELYTRGYGVARDMVAAREWYRLAADGGNAQAQFAYASLLLQDDEAREPQSVEAQGLPGVDLAAVGAVASTETALRRSARLYMSRAAEAGLPRAQFNLAQMMVAERPSFAGFKKALPLYRKAATAGLPDAQYALASLLANGSGMAAANEKEARQWLTRAALSNFGIAQVELGIWLANGRGGDARPKEALSWFERAAAKGNVVAQNRLARMHAWGVGTPVDPVRAGAWHVITKRQGFKDPEMDRRFEEYSEIDRKRAIELANRVSP